MLDLISFAKFLLLSEFYTGQCEAYLLDGLIACKPKISSLLPGENSFLDDQSFHMKDCTFNVTGGSDQLQRRLQGTKLFYLLCNSLPNESGKVKKFDNWCGVSVENCSFVPQVQGEIVCDLPLWWFWTAHLGSVNISSKFGEDTGLKCGKNKDLMCFNNISRMGLQGIPVTSYLTEKSLRGMFNLRTLELRNNSLTIVDKKTFVDVILLSFLDLSHNHIADLPQGLFCYNSLLHFLNLSRNPLSDNFTAPECLEHLLNLDLTNVGMKSIRSGKFLGLPSLTALYLADNRIVELSDGNFVGLDKLEYLDISNNSIGSLSKSAFAGLDSLRTLNLSYNHLKSIPNLKSSLENLTNIDLSFNEIDSITDHDFDMPTNSLMELNLSHNRLKYITKPMFRLLFNLVSLDLSFNLIEHIEEKTFLQFTYELKVLKLNNNRLKIVNNWLYQEDLFELPVRNGRTVTTKLSELDLSYNSLSKFQYRYLPVFVEKVNLSHNELNYTGEEIYTASLHSSIKVLDLSYNLLQKFGSDSFMDSVETLILDNNNISRLDDKLFASATNLRYVSLRNNSLTEPCQSSFTLPQIRNYYLTPRFFLSGNPIKCTCNTYWMVEYLQKGYKSLSLPLMDIAEIRCKINSTKSIAFVEANQKISNFICYSIKQLPNTCSCPSDENQCHLPCPSNCLCSRDAKWTTIRVGCAYPYNWTRIPRLNDGVPQTTTTLFLEDNVQIKRLLNTSLDDLIHLQFLSIRNCSIESIQDGTFTQLRNLTVLILDNNHLETLSKSVFYGLVSLQLLSLTYNQLKQIDSDAFEPFKFTLFSLSLRNNSLTDFPVLNLGNLKNLSLINLSGNPWSCDCPNTQNFRQWLQTNFNMIQVQDSNDLYCRLERNFSTKYVQFLTSTFLNCSDSTPFIIWRENNVTIIASASICVFSVSLIAILIFIFRWEISALLYAQYGLRLFHRADDYADKIYDVFICYSSMDYEFVLEEILPKLEPKYKTCLHERDFMPGEFILKSIFDAISNSSKVMLIVTKNFVDSNWCRFEFKMAHMKMLADRIDKIILIKKYEQIPDKMDPELKLFLRTNTYLEWGDVLFWKKLYHALPTK